MNLQAFTANFTTNVVRYESYPAEEPHCYVVGFDITYISNGKNMYTECMIPFSRNLHDYSGVVKEAWNDVHNNVRLWADQTMLTNPILNITVIPTDF